MSRTVRISVLLMLAASLLGACSRNSTLDAGSTSSTVRPTTTQQPTGKLAGMQGTTPQSGLDR